MDPIKERGVEVAMYCFTPWSKKKRVNDSAPLSFLNVGAAFFIPSTYRFACTMNQALKTNKVIGIDQAVQSCFVHHPSNPQLRWHSTDQTVIRTTSQYGQNCIQLDLSCSRLHGLHYIRNDLRRLCFRVQESTVAIPDDAQGFFCRMVVKSRHPKKECV